MFIVYIVYFLLVSSIVSEVKKKEIVEVVPVIFSAFVLMLYFLAFFNNMWIMDYAVVIAIFLTIFYVFSRTDKKERISRVFQKFCNPSFIIFFLVCLTGSIALAARGYAAFDEWHFWAVDTKSIFCLQGFAAKGLNCQPSFGDYPPATQLIEAWFTHMFGKFDEGLTMSGLFVAMQVYMAPLLTKIPKKWYVGVMAFLWMFLAFSFGPDIVKNRTPDVLMGIIYGCILVFIYNEERNGIFEYFSIACMLSVLVLVKSIGIQWAILAVVFMLGLHICRKNRNQLGMLWMLFPVIIWGSWYVFCKINDRTTYLVEGMKSQYPQELFKLYGKELFLSFLKAIFRRQQNGIFHIGVSVGVCFIFFIIVALVYQKWGVIRKAENKFILFFIVFTGIFEYVLLLISVETMFLGEYANYVNVDRMLLLIKRYGCPYIIGIWMLLLCIIFYNVENIKFPRLTDNNEINKVIIWVTIIGISIILAPIKELWTMYVSYRNIPEMTEQSMEERVTPELRQVIDIINTTENLEKYKLLVMMKDLPDNWLQMYYYVAPVPIVVDELQEGWNLDDLLEYYSCTAVCVITDIEDEISMGGIRIEDGKDIEPYAVYYVTRDDENIINISDKCE